MAREDNRGNRRRDRDEAFATGECVLGQSVGLVAEQECDGSAVRHLGGWNTALGHAPPAMPARCLQLDERLFDSTVALEDGEREPEQGAGRGSDTLRIVGIDAAGEDHA